ncbi:gluconokinase [Microbacterium azadirachtae]|uniref:Gluconokinase n=1 Tax=Microbacterium azadirachtae TaxID=582680 RepID=A0A0F0LNI0_9MICO|nr:gluconokinase [Microbacterium azadirachtae]KJL34772.1 Thermoresistant gluconokinase [Microbacterium azadirachtae]
MTGDALVDAVAGTPRARLIVVMGVSAAGKTSVMRALAWRLGIDGRDADELHSPANVAKMAGGTPLTDEDRWPWLDAVGAVLAEGRSDGGRIVACSALRRVYRDRLRVAVPDARFVHLHGAPGLLRSRAAGRRGHYMPPSLLASQLALLEPLDPEEDGAVFDVAPAVDDVVTAALAWIR